MTSPVARRFELPAPDNVEHAGSTLLLEVSHDDVDVGGVSV